MTEEERDLLADSLKALLQVKNGKWSEDSFKGRELIERLRAKLSAPATEPAARSRMTAQDRKWIRLNEEETNDLRRKATAYQGELTYNAAHRFADLITARLRELNHG